MKRYSHTCKFCLKEFAVLASKAKYCSMKCAGMSRRGVPLSEERKRRMSVDRKGQPGKNTGMHWKINRPDVWSRVGKARWLIPGYREKRKILKGAESPFWKGDKVGYRTIHHWLENHFGKSDICVHCGAKGLTGRKIHWANIDHKYKRNLKDWLRLCASCHGKFDQSKGLRRKRK